MATSLAADELAVGMITCEMFKGQTEVRPSDQRQAWAAFFQPRLQNAPEATPGPTGGWSEKKEGAHRPGRGRTPVLKIVQNQRFGRLRGDLPAPRLRHCRRRSISSRFRGFLSRRTPFRPSLARFGGGWCNLYERWSKWRIPLKRPPFRARRPPHHMTESAPYAYEIEQDGVVVASVSGPDHDQVRSEILRYARQYMQRGPITIWGTDTKSLFNILSHRSE